MMEFKNIDSFSITECCEYLKINRQDLPEAIQNLKDLKGLDMLVVSRLIFLIDTDKAAVESCGSIEQYEKYLSTWPDGLYHLFAKQRIDQLRAESEELAFYKKHKGSILGCKKYLKKYPNGKYLDKIRVNLRHKRRIRNIIIGCVIIIALIIGGIFSYEPLPTINIPPVIYVSQYGDTIMFDKYINNIVNSDNIHLAVKESICKDDMIEGMGVYRNDCYENRYLTEISYFKDWPYDISLYEEYVIPMNVSSHELVKEICITSVSKIFGFIIQEKVNVVSIKQEPVLATYLNMVSLADWCGCLEYDGFSYLSEREDSYGNNIKFFLISSNGVQDGFYVFPETDGSYIRIENPDSSWISIESSSAYEDSFSFRIRVSENRLAHKRIGYITFSCGDKYVKLVMEQKSGYSSSFGKSEGRKSEGLSNKSRTKANW